MVFKLSESNKEATVRYKELVVRYSEKKNGT